MTQNIEQRTEAAVTKYETASDAVQKLVNTDGVVNTPVGQRKSFPYLSRDIEERASNQHQEIRDRFSVAQQPVAWQPAITVSDEFQRYYVGVLGNPDYKELLPNPVLLPFSTGNDIATDISEGKFQENGVPSETRVSNKLNETFTTDVVTWQPNIYIDSPQVKIVHDGFEYMPALPFGPFNTGASWDAQEQLKWVKVRYATKDERYVDQFGADPTGMVASDDAFLKCQQQFGVVNLKPFSTYKLNSLFGSNTWILRGHRSRIILGSLLADQTFELLDIDDVVFDALNNDISRCLRVRKNSKLRLNKVSGHNMDSTTFVRFFDISTNNVDMKITDCDVYNINAAPNGVVGDVLGSCRFIYVGDETDGSDIITPSYGVIERIHGDTLTPREDGDLIHVQSGTSKKFELSIDKISGRNIAKRLVKVQVNGCPVGLVTADAQENAVNMYSIVSHYGRWGHVKHVSGTGKFDNGCDTNEPTTKVGIVNVFNIGDVVEQGAVFKSAGAGQAEHVFGQGFWHLVGAYIDYGDSDNFLNVDYIGGVSEKECLFARADVQNAGEINIKNFKGKTNGDKQPIAVSSFAGSNYKWKKCRIENATLNTDQYYNGITVRNCELTELLSIDGEALSSLCSVVGGEVFTDNVRSSGSTPYTLALNGTTFAELRSTKGGVTSAINTSGCKDTFAINTLIPNGGTVFKDEFSTPSVNNQELNTLERSL
ncbi:hypothetical protein HRO21_002855 [Vibrio parahaemolyticus]|nr:hypothetical protein [Vibrio parahaemolyticus]